MNFIRDVTTSMSTDLKPPIIIIGNVRSGTSLLQNMMALNPETIKWYEPRTLWMYADPGRNCDEFDRIDATDEVIKYVRSRFMKFQRKHGDRKIIEKTPQNILKIPYVAEIFPEAKFVYIVRHPLSYISSCERKWQRAISRKGIIRRIKMTPTKQLHYYSKRLIKDYFDKYVLRKKYLSQWGPLYNGINDDMKQFDIWTVIARQWAFSARKAENDFADLENGRVFKLRYEDLVADPQTYLERVCNHCGLKVDAAMSRAAAQLVDPKRQDTWRRLDLDVIDEVLPGIESEMELYGYDVPEDIRNVLKHGT